MLNKELTNNIQVPVEFAEAQYLHGLEQGRQETAQGLSKSLGQSKELFYPLLALTVSIIFVGVNLAFWYTGDDSDITRGGVLGSDSVAEEQLEMPDMARYYTTAAEYQSLASAKLTKAEAELADLKLALASFPAQSSNSRASLEIQALVEDSERDVAVLSQIITKLEDKGGVANLTRTDKLKLLSI